MHYLQRSYMGVASLRTVVNDGLTPRRLSHAVDGCRFGCRALGAECICRDYECPSFLAVVHDLGLRRPRWKAAGFGRDTLWQMLWAEENIMIDMI